MNAGSVPNYLNMGTQQPRYQMRSGSPGGDPATGSGSTSGGGTDWGSILTGIGGTAADIYGTQNASQAQTTGNQNAINTFMPQQQIGMGAMNTLADTLGTSGRPANYSNFLNMPGYQFAVDQGTQSINRQASAMGNLYTPNTLDAVGKYVAGTAMGDYNTYVSQLMGLANFGQNANANIAQGQINKGTAQAGGYAGTAGAIGSFLGGPNASGVSGLVNKGIGYLGGKFGGGNQPTTDAYGNPISDPNSLYAPGAGQGGNAGYAYDPNAGYGGQDSGGGFSFSDYGAAPPDVGGGPG